MNEKKKLTFHEMMPWVEERESAWEKLRGTDLDNTPSEVGIPTEKSLPKPREKTADDLTFTGLVFEDDFAGLTPELTVEALPSPEQLAAEESELISQPTQVLDLETEESTRKIPESISASGLRSTAPLKMSELKESPKSKKNGKSRALPLHYLSDFMLEEREPAPSEKFPPLPKITEPKPPIREIPQKMEITELSREDIKEEVAVQKRKEWGYGWVLVILMTIFGSITIAVYFVLLKSNITLPNILVNVSIVALLLFIIIIMIRYFSLIFLSFLHHSQLKVTEEKKHDFKILKASVLVPAYNEGKVIEQSIQSLLELNYPDYEVIVINDGSTDDTLEKARKWEGFHGKVEVIVLTQENKGKAEALNHGASVAKGEVVVCMDGDSKLDRNTVNTGMRHFDDPQTAAVAGNVKVVNRRNLLTKLQSLEYIEGLNLVRRAQAFIHAVNIIPGPIGLFRRDPLLEVGGWESDTFAEDCDLTLKLLTHGYKVDYEADAVSYTEAPEKLGPLLKQRYRWTRGILQSMKKHSSFLIRPRAGWRVLFTMWQMVLEAILWPLMNILANVVFLIVAFLFGISPLLVLWWIQLTILDTIAAMHAIAIEKESIALVPYAVIYRLVFIQFVDVAKMIATIEELLGIHMGWGKIERKGRL